MEAPNPAESERSKILRYLHPATPLRACQRPDIQAWPTLLTEFFRLHALLLMVNIYPGDKYDLIRDKQVLQSASTKNLNPIYEFNANKNNAIKSKCSMMQILRFIFEIGLFRNIL